LLVDLDPVRADSDLDLLSYRAAAQRELVSKAELEVQRARREFDQQRDLASRGFVTSKASEDADITLRLAQAQLRLARSQAQEADAAVAAQRKQQSEYRIYAPFAGRVVALTAQVGEVVSPSGQGGSFIRSGLLTLLAPQSVRVEISLQERLLAEVRTSQCALVTSIAQADRWKDRRFIVERIGEAADRQRGTITVKLAAAEPDAPPPILFSSAEVRFLPRPDARCAPHPAGTQAVRALAKEGR
jgi:multidrug resistance efflux pump